ncbi:MAG: STAS domain-containing protein [Armatimonadetes bacterium]|nr:STAS domain-containing protein [Armatimonadota bacterium]
MRTEDVRIQVVLQDVSDIPVVKVTGEIDAYTAPEFKSALGKAILFGAEHIIVDLTDVSYMDSSGFGCLLSATKRVRPRGGTINLVGCSEAIERMLKITSLDTIFGMFPTVDAAVETLSPS